MADIWFYAQNGQQTGPVSTEQLEQLAHSGRLRHTDLVWKEGLPQWVQAKSVTGLFPHRPDSAGLIDDSFLRKAAVPAPFGGDPARPGGGYVLDADPVDAPPDQRRPSGWEALPGGAKAGILVGAAVLLILAVAVPVLIYTGSRPTGPDDGDKTISARLSGWDRRDTVRMGCRAQIYNYRMKAGTIYTIRMLSNQFDTYLRLEDPTGMTVAEDDDGDAPGSLNAKIVYTAPQDGTYRIIATSFAPTQGGAYQLLITRAILGAPSPDSKAVPAFADDGDKTFSGQLTRFDPPNRFRQNSRERSYSYRMRAGTVYTIRMTANSPGFDPYLRLENPFGQVVHEDDDGDGFPNARITYVCPQDGSYRIIATSFGGTLGNYTVTVTPNR
jgi:hypothetical protein